jgi:hypothetical protein
MPGDAQKSDGCALAVAAAALLQVSAADNSDGPPKNNDDEAARRVTKGCHIVLKMDYRETFDLGLCLGVIKGLHYLSSHICVPPAISLKYIAGIISKYFDSHREQVDQDFREISLQAMRSAWPCVVQ